MIGWKGCGQKVSWPHFRYCRDIHLEGMKTANLSAYTRRSLVEDWRCDLPTKRQIHTSTCQLPSVFFFHGATAPSGSGPHFRGFTITLRHTTFGRTPMDEWSARRRDLYLTTHNKHKRQTSVPPGGIRTHNPNRRAAADPRLRPRGHCDRQLPSIQIFIKRHHSNMFRLLIIQPYSRYITKLRKENKYELVNICIKC